MKTLMRLCAALGLLWSASSAIAAEDSYELFRRVYQMLYASEVVNPHTDSRVLVRWKKNVITVGLVHHPFNFQGINNKCNTLLPLTPMQPAWNFDPVRMIKAFGQAAAVWTAHTGVYIRFVANGDADILIGVAGTPAGIGHTNFEYRVPSATSTIAELQQAVICFDPVRQWNGLSTIQMASEYRFALHELGHALGLPNHAGRYGTAMSYAANAPEVLTKYDIAAIQFLYGPPRH